MKNTISLLALIFTLSTTILAQSKLTGTILDSDSNKPVEFANISLGNSMGAVSNEKGEFAIQKLKQGEYTVTISSVGYISHKQAIRLRPDEDLHIQISLSKSNYLADDVIITATKTENYIKDIPSRVHLISPRQIESLPAQSTDELLSLIPGVNLGRSFGIYTHSTTVTMRGLNGGEQGRVLVMIDGIPTNKSDGGSVNWNLLNTDLIDRIEVVKGPGSSLYGSNAMGGAINIITKKPTENFQGKASVDYGTYNTMRGQLSLAGKLSENTSTGFYWNLNSFYRQSDGYITASEADQLANPYIVKSDLMEWGANAKLGYEINANNGFELSMLYYDDDRATGEKVYQPEGNNREHDTYHIRAKYYGAKNNLSWNINLFYLNEDYKRISEWFKDDYTFYKVLSKRTDLGALSSLSYNFKNQIITTGIDLKQGSVNAKDVYYTSTDVVYNRGKMNTFGFFLQDEINLLNEKLKVIAGLRFDYANFFDGAFEIETPTSETTFMTSYHNENLTKDTWTAFSPKLSVQYEFNKNYRIYASYGKGFRPAVLDDMCRSGRIKGGFKVADPTLQPEYLDNFEVGTDMRFFNKVRASLSAFYSIGNDFMYYVNTGDSIDLGYGLRPIIKASNISEVQIYGLEFEVNYIITSNIILNANYAYAHSQIKDYKTFTDDPVDLTNKFLSDVPEHMGSFSINWRNKIVNASVTAKYMGDRWVNDLNEIDEIILDDQYPAFTTVDIKLSRSFNRIFVNLNAQNIFDKKFYDRKGAVSPGRFLTAEIGVKF